MEKNDVLTINSWETLFPLYQEAYKHRPGRYRNLKMAVPTFSQDENLSWEQRLERLYFACGCGEAMVAGLIALVAYGVWLAVQGQLSILSAAATIPIFLLAGVLGKAVGRLRARRQLSRVVLELRDVLLGRESDEEEGWPPSELTQVIDNNIPCGNP